MRRDPRKRYGLTPLFAAPPGTVPPFRGLMPRRILPKAGYILHMVVEGDRLDLLAQHYYGDARLWWAIAQANTERSLPQDLIYENVLGSGDAGLVLRIGTELAIPPRPEDAE